VRLLWQCVALVVAACTTVLLFSDATSNCAACFLAALLFFQIAPVKQHLSPVLPACACCFNQRSSAAGEAEALKVADFLQVADFQVQALRILSWLMLSRSRNAKPLY
jgi:hypothetical protein